MIVANDLRKSYRGRNFEITALRGLSFEISANEAVYVTGRSGCGKSSLLKIVGLLDFDYEGTCLVNGQDLREANDAEVSEARRGIGFVFQDFRLIPRLTVRANLETASAVKTGTVRSSEVQACLERVGLGDRGSSFPDELSGGQKQRVAIARSIIGRPKIIIADEPTGALDATTAQQIVDLLHDVQADLGCALMVVTHDEELASRATRRIRLSDGRISEPVLS